MLKNSKFGFVHFLIILLLFSINIYADILVKVGVVDKDKIYEIYKTKPLVDVKIAYLTDTYNQKALEYKKQLEELTQKLNSTDLSNEEKQSLKEQYDNLYNEAKSLFEYTYSKIKDLKENREKYIQQDIDYAIRKVAEREGYSILIDIHSDFLIYYSITVDLTSLVLDYLQQYIIKYCNENGIDIDKYVLGKTIDESNQANQNNDNN